MAQPESTRPGVAGRLPSHAARVGTETLSRWSARLKQMVGAVLDDETLRRRGQLEQEEAEARRKARLAEAEAVLRRRQAGVHQRQAEVVAERARLEAEERSGGEHRRIEAERAAQEQLVDQDAAAARAQIQARRAQLEDATRRAEARAEAEHDVQAAAAERAEARARELEHRADALDGERQDER